MAISEKNKRVNLTIDKQLYNALQTQLLYEKMTFSEFVSKLLSDYVFFMKDSEKSLFNNSENEKMSF